MPLQKMKKKLVALLAIVVSLASVSLYVSFSFLQMRCNSLLDHGLVREGRCEVVIEGFLPVGRVVELFVATPELEAKVAELRLYWSLERFFSGETALASLRSLKGEGLEVAWSSEAGGLWQAKGEFILEQQASGGLIVGQVNADIESASVSGPVLLELSRLNLVERSSQLRMDLREADVRWGSQHFKPREQPFVLEAQAAWKENDRLEFEKGLVRHPRFQAKWKGTAGLMKPTPEVSFTVGLWPPEASPPLDQKNTLGEANCESASGGSLCQLQFSELELRLLPDVPKEFSEVQATGRATFQRTGEGESVRVEISKWGGRLNTKEIRKHLEQELSQFSTLGIVDKGIELLLRQPGPAGSKTLQSLGLTASAAGEPLHALLPDRLSINSGTTTFNYSKKSGSPESIAHESDFSISTQRGEVRGWHKTPQPEESSGEVEFVTLNQQRLKLQMRVPTLSARPHFYLSQQEKDRLVNLALKRLENEPVKVTLPSPNEVKQLEEAGKKWLEGMVKKSDEGSTAEERKDAEKKMRESEEKLKNAVKKLLGTE